MYQELVPIPLCGPVIFLLSGCAVARGSTCTFGCVDSTSATPSSALSPRLNSLGKEGLGEGKLPVEGCPLSVHTSGPAFCPEGSSMSFRLSFVSLCWGRASICDLGLCNLNHRILICGWRFLFLLPPQLPGQAEDSEGA